MKKSISEKENSKEEPQAIYIDRCWQVSPNNANTTQEIWVSAKDFTGKEYDLVFTPDDWLDTFTPTMYNHIKKEYIKYLENKE